MPDRPHPGDQCRHAGRPAEVRSSYPARGVFHVVGRYLDKSAEDPQLDLTHFVAPWSECMQEVACD